MSITNDYTNVFNYFGSSGVGPGNHQYHEKLSTKKLAEILTNLNKISKSSGYQYLSDEGHLTMFYGMLSLKKIDGTMSVFLDPSFSFSGINLTRISDDASICTCAYNIETNMFEIPIEEDIIYSYYKPIIRFTTLYNDPSLALYRPVFSSFNTNGSFLAKFQLLHLLDGTSADITTLNTYDDYDIKIGMFGVSTILTEDL